MDYGYAKLQLTDEPHMRSYITLVKDIELDRIKMSLKNSNYFAIILMARPELMKC